jgi:hypothetical protein
VDVGILKIWTNNRDTTLEFRYSVFADNERLPCKEFSERIGNILGLIRARGIARKRPRYDRPTGFVERFFGWRGDARPLHLWNKLALSAYE